MAANCENCNASTGSIKGWEFLNKMSDYKLPNDLVPAWYDVLDLGTRWRWAVSFTPRPLYLQGKSPQYPLHRRLGGVQSRSGSGGEKNSQLLPTLEPPTIQHVPQHYTAELSRLLHYDKQQVNFWLTKHNAMKTCWRGEGIVPYILDLGTRWRWVVRFTSGRFSPDDRAHGTHSTGDWVGLRANLYAMSLPGLEPQSSSTWLNL
jgi:hypothetical protein